MIPAAVQGIYVLPQRNASAPKTTSPRYFEDYLSRRWAEGCVRGQRLFNEIRSRGYSGSFSNLERLLAKWRSPKRKARRASVLATARLVNPAPRRPISPIVAAALCIKPRALLTSSQAAKIDALKGEWPEFAAMRQLAMRFRGMLRSKKVSKLGAWLKAADQSGLYAIQRFACILRRDFAAVRNAVTEPWSNGQTEGQINRLKTSQASHVRSCWSRASARADVAVVGPPATENEAEPSNVRISTKNILTFDGLVSLGVSRSNVYSPRGPSTTSAVDRMTQESFRR